VPGYPAHRALPTVQHLALEDGLCHLQVVARDALVEHGGGLKEFPRFMPPFNLEGSILFATCWTTGRARISSTHRGELRSTF
jgi:hypothetical protein